MSLLGKVKRKVTRQKQKHIASLVALLAATLITGQALAMPEGGHVDAGSVNISDLRNIIVNSNGVINWNKFNIGNGEAVNFQFANSASGVLNRVNGGTTADYISTIAGKLSSSGNPGTIMLVNPAGIVFANGAVINVPTFIAGTGSIDNDAFFNILKDGNKETFLTKGSTGIIQFNSNVTLQGSTDLVAYSPSITVAPGVTITASSRDSSISLFAAESMSAQTKVGDNGKYYLQFVGLSTKTGNDITLGDSTGGAMIIGDYVTLMGNKISLNGTASKNTTLASLGQSSDSSIDIIAGNNVDGNFSNSAFTLHATDANKIIINNTTIGGAQVRIIGNSLTNTGVLDLAHSGQYTVVLAEGMNGNGITGGTGNVIQGKNDAKYNSAYPFNVINETVSSDGNKTWSFSRTGVIDSGASFEENKKNIEKAAGSITNDTNAGQLINEIVTTSGLSQAEQNGLVHTVVYSYTPAREVMNRTDGQANGALQGSTPIANGVGTPANTAVNTVIAPITVGNNSASNTVVTVSPSEVNSGPVTTGNKSN